VYNAINSNTNHNPRDKENSEKEFETKFHKPKIFIHHYHKTTEEHDRHFEYYFPHPSEINALGTLNMIDIQH